MKETIDTLSNISLQVEGDLGAELQDIILDCKALAERVGIRVWVEANGTSFVVYPNCLKWKIKEFFETYPSEKHRVVVFK